MAHQTEKTQLIFRAIADSTRREIIYLLAQADMTVGEVAERFAMSRPAVAKHLGILEEGGLIKVKARGRERVNQLQSEGLKTVKSWAAQFDTASGDSLAALKRAVEEAYEAVNED